MTLLTRDRSWATELRKRLLPIKYPEITGVGLARTGVGLAGLDRAIILNREDIGKYGEEWDEVLKNLREGWMVKAKPTDKGYDVAYLTPAGEEAEYEYEGRPLSKEEIEAYEKYLEQYDGEVPMAARAMGLGPEYLPAGYPPELEEAYREAFLQPLAPGEYGPVIEATDVTAILDWATESDENLNTLFQTISDAGRTPETENLLKAIGATTAEVDEFFAPYPVMMKPGLYQGLAGVPTETEPMWQKALDWAFWPFTQVGTFFARLWSPAKLVGLTPEGFEYEPFPVPQFAEDYSKVAHEELADMALRETMANIKEMGIPESQWDMFLLSAKTFFDLMIAQQMATMPGGVIAEEFEKLPWWKQMIAEAPLWVALAGVPGAQAIKARMARRALEPGVKGVVSGVAAKAITPVAKIEAGVGFVFRQTIGRVANTIFSKANLVATKRILNRLATEQGIVIAKDTQETLVNSYRLAFGKHLERELADWTAKRGVEMSDKMADKVVRYFIDHASSKWAAQRMLTALGKQTITPELLNTVADTVAREAVSGLPKVLDDFLKAEPAKPPVKPEAGVLVTIPPQENIINATLQPNWQKSVLQIIGKLSGGERLVKLVDPRELVSRDAKVITDIVNRNIIGWQEVIKVGQGVKAIKLGELQAITTNPVGMFAFNKNAYSRTMADRILPDYAGTIEAGTLEYVFIHPEMYNWAGFSKGLDYVNTVHRINTEVLNMLSTEGVAPEHVVEGWWIHRVVQGKYDPDGEIIAIRGRPGMRGRMAAKKAYEMHRKAPTMHEGMVWKIKYAENPELSITTYIEEAFSKIAGERFYKGTDEALTEIGKPGKSPLEVLADKHPEIAKRAEITEKEKEYAEKALGLIKNVIRGLIPPMQTLNAIERHFPEIGKRLKALSVKNVETENDLRQVLTNTKRTITNLQKIVEKQKEALEKIKTADAAKMQKAVEQARGQIEAERAESLKFVPDEFKLKEAFRVMRYDERMAFRDALDSQLAEMQQILYEQEGQVQGLLEYLRTDLVASYRGFLGKRKGVKLTSVLVQGQFPESVTVKQAAMLLMKPIEQIPQIVIEEGRVKRGYVLDQLTTHFGFESDNVTEAAIEAVYQQEQTVDDLRMLLVMSQDRYNAIKRLLGIMDTLERPEHIPMPEPPPVVQPEVVPTPITAYSRRIYADKFAEFGVDFDAVIDKMRVAKHVQPAQIDNARRLINFLIDYARIADHRTNITDAEIKQISLDLKVRVDEHIASLQYVDISLLPKEAVRVIADLKEVSSGLGSADVVSQVIAIDHLVSIAHKVELTVLPQVFKVPDIDVDGGLTTDRMRAIYDLIADGKIAITKPVVQPAVETITVYHATIEKNLNNIQKEGLKTPEGVMPSRWFMVTDNLEGAKKYATGASPRIIRYDIPANEIDKYLWPSLPSVTYGNQFGLRQALPSKYITQIARPEEMVEARLPAIPKAEPGMPEAGLQTDIFGYQTPHFPKGKGEIKQISMEDYNKLVKAWKDAGLPEEAMPVAIRPQVEGIPGLEAETTIQQVSFNVPEGMSKVERLAELNVLKTEVQALVDGKKVAYLQARMARTQVMERIKQAPIGEGYLMQSRFAGKIYDQEFIDAVNVHFGHNPGSKSLKFTSDLAGILRITKASLDLSFHAIQGMPSFGLAVSYMMTNPTKGARMMGTWFNAQFQAMRGIFDPVSVHAYIVKYKDDGLQRVSFGGSSAAVDYFETLRTGGGLAGFAQKGMLKIPFKPYHRAEFAFYGAGEIIRNEFWSVLKDDAIRNGKEYELAQFLDRMTGIISTEAMGVPITIRQLESSWVWFAPRYTRACLTMLSNLFRGGYTGAKARRSLGAMIAAGITMYAGFQYAKATLEGEDEEEAWNSVLEGFGVYYDPILETWEWKPSARLMTFKIGNYNMGIGGFWYGLVRLTGNIMATIDEVGDRELIDFVKIIKNGTLNRDNPFLYWWLTRASPFLGVMKEAGGSLLKSIAGLELFAGSDFLGYPIETPWDYMHYILTRFEPIWAEQGVNWMIPGMAREQEIPEGIARFLLPATEMFGLRTFPEGAWVEFYDKATEYINRLPQDILDDYYTEEELAKILEAQRQGKLKWEHLPKLLQDKLLEMYPDLRGIREEALEDSSLRGGEDWKQWEAAADNIKDEYYGRGNSLVERLQRGDMDTREFRELWSEAGQNYGIALDTIKDQEFYRVIYDYFEKKRAEGTDYDWDLDLALLEYQTVVFTEYLNKKGDIDWDAKDRAVADYIERWGEDVYMMIRQMYAEKKEMEGLSPTLTRLSDDKDKLTREYWQLPYKPIIEMDLEDETDGNIPAEYYTLWKQYQALKTDTERETFILRYPDMARDWRGEYRKSHTEEDAILALWGYGGKLQTREAYDLVEKWSQELGIPMSQMGLGLPPRNLIEPYFGYIELATKFSGNSAEARLYRMEHPNFDVWGQENWGWSEVEGYPEALRISTKWREKDDQYNALPTTEERESFLEANLDYAKARRQRDAYNMELPESLIDTYAEWYTTEHKDYEDDWFLMEHKEFYQAMVDKRIWQERDFSKVPSREVFALLGEYNETPEGKARLVFRHEHPDLEKWLVNVRSYTPVGDRWKEAEAVKVTPEEDADKLVEIRKRLKELP